MGGVHSISRWDSQPRGRTPCSDRRCRARSPARNRPRMPTASSRARHRAVTAAAPPEGARFLAAVRARPRRDVLLLRRAARRRASLLRPLPSHTRARAERARRPRGLAGFRSAALRHHATSRHCRRTIFPAEMRAGAHRARSWPSARPRTDDRATAARNRSSGVTLRNNDRARSPRDQRLRVGVRFDSQRYHRVQAGTVYKQ